MMLIILDKEPEIAAELVPNKVKFKQLLELGQLICSVGISSEFKGIKQGKELQNWVKQNLCWVNSYFKHLYLWSLENIKMSNETIVKFNKILKDLNIHSVKERVKIESIIFRYSSQYEKCTKYGSNSTLPIKVGIKEYKKYVQWKGDKWR